MATVTSLGFSIFSRFSGRGIQQAQRALRALNSIDTSNLGKSFESSMKRVDNANLRARRNFDFSRRSVYSFIGAMSIASPTVLSAGTAFAAFSGLVVPAIGRVIKASVDMSGSWDSLSKSEQASAQHVRGLVNDYRRLARSYEPQALQTFNAAMGTSRTLLPQVDRFVQSTSGHVQNLVNRFLMFTEQRVGGQFLSWAGRAAPEALDVLGTTLLTTGDTVLDLVQDLTPLGITLLHATNGMIGFANMLASANPLLAQFAFGTLLLKGPLTKMTGWFGGVTRRYGEFAKANKGASLATKGLNLAMSAGAPLMIAAGAALAFFAIKAFTAKDSTDRLIQSLKLQRNAAGNNLKLYQQQAAFLNSRYNAANRDAAASLGTLNDSTYGVITSTEKLGIEAEKAQQRLRNMERNSSLLAGRLGVTTEEARRFADMAGVNLATNVDKAGNLTASAAEKVRMYAEAARISNNATSTLSIALADAANKALVFKDRLDAMKVALQAQLNPTLDAFNATTKLREGFKDLSGALGKNKASFDGNNAASLQLRKSFSDNIEQVRNLHTAIFEKTRSIDAANAAVRRYIPVLFAAAGTNREAREAVQALANVTGFQIGRTEVSRKSFITQATAMLGSKKRAEELWAAYRRLQNATGGVTSATGQAITRVKTMAEAARQLHVRTSGVTGAQNTYNQTVRRALPVLYALAGNNKSARAQVDALARSVGVATGKVNTSRTAFVNMAAKMGIARDRAERLWKEMRKINDRNAKVTVAGQGTWKYAFNALAKGGPVVGTWPGANQQRDSQPALLRVNEHVWTPEEVQAVGGHGAMYRLRAMARQGELQGFRSGGRVGRKANLTGNDGAGVVWDPIRLGWNQFMRDIGALLKKQFGGGPALSWAKTQAGKPYIWGGVGPRGYDCSGFMSAITNVIRHRPPHRRLFTTHSFKSGSPAGFVRNLRSPFTVGVRHDGVGHMAGTLYNTNVEAGGGPRGSRVYVGSGADGTSAFPNHFGLRMADGGRVDQIIKRAYRFPHSAELALAAVMGLVGDKSSQISPKRRGKLPMYGDGGYLPPGRLAITGERGPEIVRAGSGGATVTPVSGGSGGGGETHIHLHNHGVLGSRIEVEDWLIKTTEKLKRQGRIK